MDGRSADYKAGAKGFEKIGGQCSPTSSGQKLRPTREAAVLDVRQDAKEGDRSTA